MSSQSITAQDLQVIGDIPDQIEALHKKFQDLATKLERIFPARPTTTIIPVQSLEDEDLGVTKMFHVVVEETGDDFVATFFDAHISSSGETPYEAVDNVKDMVAATFRRLSKTPTDKLGPLPSKQLAVLRKFISQA